jgi:hypothetical protein
VKRIVVSSPLLGATTASRRSASYGVSASHHSTGEVGHFGLAALVSPSCLLPPRRSFHLVDCREHFVFGTRGTISQHARLGAFQSSLSVRPGQ